jgi:hypothetical protein
MENISDFFIFCSLMSRMRMISTMLGTMWGHFPKILDTVLLIRMEMDLQAHLSVNRSQGFFLWVSEGQLKAMV